MSRRSRRRTVSGRGPWLGKALIGIGGALLVGFGLGYLAFRSYLHSEAFRKFLAAEAGGSLKMSGGFEPFRWDGLAVETAGFKALGTGSMAELDVENIGTEIGFGGVRRGVWEVKATRIAKLKVTLDLTGRDGSPPERAVEREADKERKKSGWLPHKVELESLDIGEIAILAKTTAGVFQAAGMSLGLDPDRGGDPFKAELKGGSIKTPFGWVPELRTERVSATWHEGNIFVTRAEAGAWKDARISAFGEWDARTRKYSFGGKLDHVGCGEVLDDNWARRLTGDIATTFTVGNPGSHMQASGNLEILNGTLTALPMLDSLSAYADTRRFRILQLSEARTKWRWEDGALHLTDLAMGSEGLIRIEGGLTLRGNALDGQLRLGLIPGTLSKIPGAETDVFTPGTHGLLWAPLRITGTLDDPEEDLTERLIGAAGMRMFETLPETGETVLRFTGKPISDIPGETLAKGFRIIGEGRKAIDQGRKILGDDSKFIEKGEKAIKSAESFLEGILGGGALPERRKPRANPPGKAPGMPVD